ncbi:protocatechuate 3,4-dioxygenase [Cupriavidus sp. USMAA2-4]|uniref:Protocatechuate 3,4-dioxygenase n=1 Tax=Cupriavidus malaysiensis TaxID=367825 RepID=A0ABN4TST3_9BURK|nr:MULTISPECIES: protocatechuate 3,4-dioxygenase [Cupriavidus]AOY96315.1 protocatechuate 3,4-dioxygenase [Cupriavidus sp. USMAA2-4]AOZ03282.1 protocatechuate 3,4-dioxygenase [Cupriavidus sp. USMAHM13]AOZ09356.1 protocatechuate 3,4-dioxygenase [Cupriavidus malaysiensis]
MARLVAAFGSSHSIMLVSQREDWQHGFRQVDPKNPHYYDSEGNATTYEKLLAIAPPDAEAMVTPERMGERFDQAEAAMDTLRDRIHAARLDVLLVVGDDQTELFRTTNNPAFAIYYGETIRNAKREEGLSDGWYKKARMARQEPDADREYPVAAGMARWLIRELCDRDFDIAAMDGLERGQFEGHAFSFIHRRYLQGIDLPVVPVIVNTFDPPNQPTPRRCIQLGATLRELIAGYPEDLRVGVLASGGLSHFVVDEALDEGIIDAIRRKDTAYLAALDPKQLQAGSSEIRNWLIAVEAVKDLDLEWVSYTPGYRSPALTGTGLCFAAWRTLD